MKTLLAVLIKSDKKILVHQYPGGIVKAMLNAQWISSNKKDYMRVVARRIQTLYGYKINFRDGYLPFLESLNACGLIELKTINQED